jgi:hypothetical protein
MNKLKNILDEGYKIKLLVVTFKWDRCQNRKLLLFLVEERLLQSLPPLIKMEVPHVVPLWFILDSESNIIFGTETRSIKGRNILRDPRVSICVDDHQYPYSFVSIFGQADVVVERPSEIIEQIERWKKISEP